MICIFCIFYTFCRRRCNESRTAEIPAAQTTQSVLVLGPCATICRRSLLNEKKDPAEYFLSTFSTADSLTFMCAGLCAVHIQR